MCPTPASAQHQRQPSSLRSSEVAPLAASSMDLKGMRLRPRVGDVPALQHCVDLMSVRSGGLGAWTCNGNGRGGVGETCGVDQGCAFRQSCGHGPRKDVAGCRCISNGHCQPANREAGLAGVEVQTLPSQRHDRSINAPFDENMPGGSRGIVVVHGDSGQCFYFGDIGCDGGDVGPKCLVDP